MSGLDVTIFERIFKSGNKSGNSILRTFSDSGLDVMEGVDKHADKKQHFVPRVYLKAWEIQVETLKEPDKKFKGIYVIKDGKKGEGAKFIHVNTVAPFGTFRTKIRKWKKIAL